MYFQTRDKILCGDYVRLSREDGDKLESDSIRNQKDLIADYHRKHPEMTFVQEYVDDGFSGTNYERPGFQRMLEDAKIGKINCIIVKDLSRLGRNYIETGRYLEKIFPAMGIRFIAINDHYDSADEKDDSDNIIIPFKNLINDAYCRDISTKIRSQLDVKRKNGQFIGSFAGYGYRKDPRDKNRLLVDEYAAEIVRLIFKLKLDGMSSQRIAGHLDEIGALPPMEYKLRCGMNFNSGFRAGKEQKWSAVAVSRILKNELYTGVMVQGKRRKINYKVKKSIAVDENQWIRVNGTHEAIIPQAVFDQVQKMMEMDTRTAPNQDTVQVFSGLLRCGGCGQSMVKRCSCKDGKKYDYYHCSTYKNGNGCSSHLIRESKLTEAVLDAIQRQASLLVRADNIIAAAGKIPENQFSVKAMDGQLSQLERDAARYQDLKAHLYQDMHDGTISREEFKDMNARFTKLRQSTKEKLSQLEEKRKTLLNRETSLQPWLEDFQKYGNITHLERKVLTALVDHITVYGKDSIEIHFCYEDEIKLFMKVAEEYESHSGTGEETSYEVG
ncbi:MAG: recombinase family protein [Clostridiales bacterium]|nr:recombinase family protein [Clostridiales bacterium]